MNFRIILEEEKPSNPIFYPKVAVNATNVENLAILRDNVEVNEWVSHLLIKIKEEEDPDPDQKTEKRKKVTDIEAKAVNQDMERRKVVVY